MKPRDVIASMAMHGYLLNSDHFAALMRKSGSDIEVMHRMVAEASYELADAMIAKGAEGRANDQ